MFGTVSFLPPIIANEGQFKACGSNREDVDKSRQQQVTRAQRGHRQRQKSYMDALEEEVRRLRVETANLAEAAVYWRRYAAMQLMERKCPDERRRERCVLSPGLFLWRVPPADPWLDCLQASTPTISRLTRADAHVPALLKNFLDNIIPTLEITEAAQCGYEKFVMPLAIHHEMVISAYLAASASHLQLYSAGTWAMHNPKYRLAAIAGLGEAARENAPEASHILHALTAILGLMIADMISCNKEHRGFLRLAQFWSDKPCYWRPGAHETLARHFLLDQIQMYGIGDECHAMINDETFTIKITLTQRLCRLKTLVYPAYEYELSPAQASVYPDSSAHTCPSDEAVLFKAKTPNWSSAMSADSSPSSSIIFPSLSLNMLVPENRISLPELGTGRLPTGKSKKASPVCVPPPNQRATT
ncbi:hypothetical protein NLG97_g5208 [Lecanicillium saksenae]|uniref:Uncharacterized protein n=1 Tax=Lecanicillium saksenae TaxID=468837 RepID=A0ACC1QT58_9HYPO|nr:hypothetical protein NLG97_g5208 [Lecanicillium saksenae]